MEAYSAGASKNGSGPPATQDAGTPTESRAEAYARYEAEAAARREDTANRVRDGESLFRNIKTSAPEDSQQPARAQPSYDAIAPIVNAPPITVAMSSMPLEPANPIGFSPGDNYETNTSSVLNNHAKNVFNINAARDPGATADAVVKAQDGMFMDLLRNLHGSAD